MVLFMGLQYLVDRKLADQLESNLEKARAHFLHYALYLREHGGEAVPVYLTIEVRKNQGWTYVPFVGFLEENTLDIWSVGIDKPPLDEPITRTEDRRLNLSDQRLTTYYTWSELLVP